MSSGRKPKVSSNKLGPASAVGSVLASRQPPQREFEDCTFSTRLIHIHCPFEKEDMKARSVQPLSAVSEVQRLCCLLHGGAKAADISAEVRRTGSMRPDSPSRHSTSCRISAEKRFDLAGDGGRDSHSCQSAVEKGHARCVTIQHRQLA